MTISFFYTWRIGLLFGNLIFALTRATKVKKKKKKSLRSICCRMLHCIDLEWHCINLWMWYSLSIVFVFVWTFGNITNSVRNVSATSVLVSGSLRSGCHCLTEWQLDPWPESLSLESQVFTLSQRFLINTLFNRCVREVLGCTLKAGVGLLYSFFFFFSDINVLDCIIIVIIIHHRRGYIRW